jgi:hypothetical protein
MGLQSHNCQTLPKVGILVDMDQGETRMSETMRPNSPRDCAQIRIRIKPTKTNF